MQQGREEWATDPTPKCPMCGERHKVYVRIAPLGKETTVCHACYSEMTARNPVMVKRGRIVEKTWLDD